MKRYISIVLALFLLAGCLFAATPTVYASGKTSESRAIAIVFDNSGSMYQNGKKDWSRATYAMEVFASMLNAGDTLMIYPMHPIKVGGKEYTMDNPLKITDAAKASTIREIFTPDPLGTPIESVDRAIEGLKAVTADKKYMIVLTDGASFYRNGYEMTAKDTKRELDTRFKANAGKTMTVMYLGVGRDTVMPDTPQSEYFVKKHAKESDEVLSALTDMCNKIFGRDTLPAKNVDVKNKTIKFDISMKKLVVFVQGENVANLKIANTSGSSGKQLSVSSTKYSTEGCGDRYKEVPDTSLQGMMVTYEGCPAGTYQLSYSGEATSVEVYYEPDADLDFVFTDAAGNTVDPNALYEGDYKVSFGMKDAKTGKLISSELLGNPTYQGSYFVDGKEVSFTHEGFSGSQDVSLKMGEKFKAELTATYLSGYTISKDSSDFGWPEGGIVVAPKPAGDLRLEISGGDEEYSLQELESGAPFVAKVYYQGTQLTGSELEGVSLKWDPETSNAEIKKEFADDHWKLYLHYKDPESPKDTACGECTVSIYAYYSAQGSSEAQAQSPLTYYIKDDFTPLQIELFVPESYIVIGELEESKAIVAKLKLNGAPLTAEEFASVTLDADCGGIAHTITPCPEDSSFLIKLLPTEGIAEDNYDIKINTTYVDQLGRETQNNESANITLSNTPMWVKWVIGISLLFLLILLILLIARIRVLPSHANVRKKESKLIVDSEDVSKNATFNCELKKDLEVITKYGGKKFGFAVPVKPGKESYLYKKQTNRYAETQEANTINKRGNAVIEKVTIGSVNYTLNEDNGKLERKPPSKAPIKIKHGTPIIYSGTITSAGIKKSFNVNTKINAKKK